MFVVAKDLEVATTKSYNLERRVAEKGCSDSETLLKPKAPGKAASMERSLSFKNWEQESEDHEAAVPSATQASDCNQRGCAVSNGVRGLLILSPNKRPVIRMPSLKQSPMPSGELDAAAVTVQEDYKSYRTRRNLADCESLTPSCELHAADSERHAAAVTVQKVFKSYRTRRNLADCAVIIEELWWKALDYASLTTVSSFDIEKHETVVKRWNKAKKRLAKVGKGLLKDEHAQKLALQHWLEAIDPRHRYGHNLHMYYDVWFSSESAQPFFYWLDIGDGKDVSLEKCPRRRLHKQCINYLGPNDRAAYEVIVKNGKLMYKIKEALVDTDEESKWIFVLSPSRNLYVGKKKKGKFQHSSFLAGAATTAAGRLVAKDGILKAIWPYSGHYLPTNDNFKEFISFLTDHDVDMSDVKRCGVDDDEFASFRKSDEAVPETEEIYYDTESQNDTGVNDSTQNTSEIDPHGENNADQSEAPAFDFTKRLSCKWSTGAGPRIGCVRDYPADLQSMALEHVNLSPRVNFPPMGSRTPIPSPRPSPKLRLSPRLSYMGIPSPRVALTLPTPRRR